MIRHDTFDRIAITLSSLCAIHCIVLPIAASITPILVSTIDHGNSVHEFWFHQFILMFIIPVSVFALIAGYRCHHNKNPIYVATIGLVLLTIVALFAELLITQGLLSHTGETTLTVIGGVIHATGHVMNAFATKASHTSTCATSH